MTEVSTVRSSVSARSGIPWRVPVATCLSLEAALIHAWYVPESFLEWWGYGVFFTACALGQAAYAPLLLMSRRPFVVVGGIWPNALVVSLYVVTRVWGIPLGPHREAVEPVGIFDLAAVVSETTLVVLLATMLDGRSRRATVNGLMLLGVSLWALRFAVGPILA